MHSSLIPSLNELKKRVTQQNTKKKVLRKQVFKSKVKVFNMCCMWLLIYFQTALQLYDRGKKVLKKDWEHEKWSQIDHNYMTERVMLSVVMQHRFPWRSKGIIIEFHVDHSFVAYEILILLFSAK